MKKIFKFFNIILVSYLLISMFSCLYASELQTKMKVVQKTSDPEYFNGQDSYINHEIVSCNEETGEINAKININNYLEEGSQHNVYDETEILIILSENIVTEEEIFEEYTDYISTLFTKILEKNPKTKIGIIGAKGSVYDLSYDEDGKLILGEKDQGTVMGTENDAEIVIEQTDNVEDIKNAILNMNSSKTNYYINLEAALHLARNSYSDNKNKILISLYDTVPAIANGVASRVSFGGPLTLEQAVILKHEEIVEKTKAEILSLKDENIDLILLRPEDTSFDEEWFNVQTGNKDLDFDGSPYVLDLYGTIDNPTYGKMYSITDENLEKIVTENIYEDVIEKVNRKITSVTLENYFPEVISKNFDITIKDQENQLQTDSNGLSYYTWNIGDVNSGEQVSLEYTLKIKDMKNAELLNKIINISDDVKMTYTNSMNNKKTARLTSSPKVELEEEMEAPADPGQTTPQKPDNPPEQKPDDTVAPEKIPQTGLNYVYIIIPISLIAFTIVIYKKYGKYKDI